MPFWTSQDLERQAPQLITPYSPSSIDCNSYTLHMGDEYFCTADQSRRPGVIPTIQKLTDHQGFTIPPGQFAFLLTQEKLHVPKDSMAFISIKSGMKFHGLVNVSGFHVDPGYQGRVIFSVYNAGPSPISLKQGMPLFPIWFTKLNEESEKSYSDRKGYSRLEPKMIQGMTDEILSLQSMTEEIKNIQNTFIEHKPILDHLSFFYRALVIAVVAAFVIGLSGFSWDFGRSIWSRISAPNSETITPSPGNTTDQETPAPDNAAGQNQN